MDKLYLAIKNKIEEKISAGDIANISLEWDRNQLDETQISQNSYPLALYKTNRVTYLNSKDPFTTAEMEIGIKCIFKGLLDDADTKPMAQEGFQIVKSLGNLLNGLVSEESGPLELISLEEQKINNEVNVFLYTLTAPFYPPKQGPGITQKPKVQITESLKIQDESI